MTTFADTEPAAHAATTPADLSADRLLPSATPLQLIDADGQPGQNPGDLVRPGPEILLELYRQMVIGRRFDRQATALTKSKRRTEFTIVEPRAIQAALDNARQTGVAYDREEAYKGLGCVASPIRSGDRVMGAVSVTGPIARIRAHSLVHEVRNTAIAIWSGDVVPLPRPLASAR